MPVCIHAKNKEFLFVNWTVANTRQLASFWNRFLCGSPAIRGNLAAASAAKDAVIGDISDELVILFSEFRANN